jgi:type II restriction/modification system DNA methylase subunit YeeA
MPITPQEFVSKWKRAGARERQSVQEHFIDLCNLVGHPTPMEFDSTGEVFAFEMGAKKTSGKQGWADVAKLKYFGWEYKAQNADLDKAYNQLLQYRDSLQNPPLLVVSDMSTIIIRTNYTNYKTQCFTLTLDDLLTSEGLRTLKAVFFNPEELRPNETLQAVTEKAAREFAALAQNMLKYGEDRQKTSHFLIRLLFCLFAQDIGLLPQGLISRIVEQTRNNSRDLAEALKELFSKMSKGGFFGADRIPYINGGLFDDDTALQLDSNDIATLSHIDKLDWAFIQPSIFGTLFERGLDPSKRSQLGAHYTSEDDILLIVEPVLMAPLRREWDELQKAMQKLADERDMIRMSESENINTTIRGELQKFADKIASIQVLDPACGSGNFLYVALRLLLDLQKQVSVFCESLRAGRLEITVSPNQLHGIEINEYAHELAQLTIWIGYIQWRVDNGYGLPGEPILKPIDNIQHMDAILGYKTSEVSETSEVYEPEWPAADVIIGNPPFLGDKKMRAELGDKYVDDLRKLFGDRIPGQSDLVCYWFEKARAMIKEGTVKRAGLLATNSIRGGANRTVLERIKESGNIFWAQSNRDWILDGAAVNVSMVGFDNNEEGNRKLDNQKVENINPDLTGISNLTSAYQLEENLGIAFIGPSPHGPFDVEKSVAQQMIKAPNIHGRSNSDVVRPVASGIDIVQRSRGLWTIDFGAMPFEEAAKYESPFEYAKKNIFPIRSKNKRANNTDLWWQYERPRQEMRDALKELKRFISTPRVSKHRIFIWLPIETLSNDGTTVFAREDDYFIGVLQSKPHVIWSLKLGTSLEDRPRYTPSTSFETFPFPWSPGKEPKKDPRVKVIAQAAKELVEQRDRWLKPEETFGIDFKKRTLTNLYNERPTWLDLAHKRLDSAVFAAYGWPDDLSDEQILERLLSLNLERSSAKRQSLRK